MAKKSNPNTNDLLSFSKNDIKIYIHQLQDDLQIQLKSGKSIDDILDLEDPFEALEPILPQEVYPILVLAMINDIRSETVMNAILSGLDRGMKSFHDKKDL